ncbi:MAG: ArsB/NhaD family transporter [Spirochaetaceae bacterium]|jgi:Na+/H+ antiporter NhaD/arsenite permease-like protein|nr:ArsB/NhaD family transporter [Spirochaetaceae bacterium]
MSLLAWVSLIVFLAAFVFISTEKINKTIVALLGASFFIFMGIIDPEGAFSVIDWNVIFLLVSMMVIINITKTTGLFEFVAIKTAKAVRGDPVKILVMLSIVTALFSSILDNVTTVLILSPVAILIATQLGISPAPFIISMAIASNIGGTATLIGDPPNIMIGSAANLDFIDFLINLGPVIILVLIVMCILTALLFHKQLKASNEAKARIMDMEEKRALTDKPLMLKCIVVLVLVIAGFLTHNLLNVEASTVAMGGAALLLLLTRKKDIEPFLRDAEWGTIFFFVGLFILVGGVEKEGWISKAASFIMNVTDGNIRFTSVILVWVSGILSAVVDNIPYVATMIPMVQQISGTVGTAAAEPLWWALALGACLGGNGTLIGASANVVSAGIATRSGYPITFKDFTKYGALITVISLFMCTGYVLIRYF